MSSDQNQFHDNDAADANAADSKDITPILQNWNYESGTLGVRKIMGRDGLPKLQMRLDLGLLQMELVGRPDGERPKGFDSLLDYHEHTLSDYKLAHGTDRGYELTIEECHNLREEAVQYYHRYLSLFILEDFEAVARDTKRNLRLLELCRKYAADEDDRTVLERYRPYTMMMNLRARGSILVKTQQYDKALRLVRRGLSQIKAWFISHDHEQDYARSGEVRLLRKFSREIREKMPVNPIRVLEKQLDRAVKAERYEEAAKLRDEIKAKKAQSSAM